jgi:hypothetical protein
MPAGGAEEPGAPPASIEAQVAELMRRNAEMERAIAALQQEVRSARDDARAAREQAEGSRLAPPPPVSATPTDDFATDAPLLSRSVGRAKLQLLDISLDTLFAVGGSTANEGDLLTLQGGEHDPRNQGFTLQQVELSFMGAVDPYLAGEAHLVYFLDEEGESRFEIEEAFMTTQMLPFGLEEFGFQVEGGHFFTEYGRINPVHPHAWDWQDQPLVNTRLLGGDGIRQVGFRLGWLTPLPWFSELSLGVQNGRGETMVSFLANDEVFTERPIGGRPFTRRSVNGPDDLTWLARWTNGFDLSDTLSGLLGFSGLFGPNATGGSGKTIIYGADFTLKWRPLVSDRGWPFVTWQTEFSGRSYEADSYVGCPGDPDCAAQPFLAGETLNDWGLYSQVNWGFRRGWAAGLRAEYATGDGLNVEFDEIAETWTPVSRNSDPYRADRVRISPLLTFHPSEFSRLRLQYNYDHAENLDDESVHTVWAGFEFLFGAHPAHGY